MKPDRIQQKLAELFGWTAHLKKRGRQTIQRIFALATYQAAVRFVAAVGELAEEHTLYPHVEVSPGGPEGVPTKVTVRITRPGLVDADFELAHAVNAAYAAGTEEAGV